MKNSPIGGVAKFTRFVSLSQILPSLRRFGTNVNQTNHGVKSITIWCDGKESVRVASRALADHVGFHQTMQSQSRGLVTQSQLVLDDVRVNLVSHAAISRLRRILRLPYVSRIVSVEIASDGSDMEEDKVGFPVEFKSMLPLAVFESPTVHPRLRSVPSQAQQQNIKGTTSSPRTTCTTTDLEQDTPVQLFAENIKEIVVGECEAHYYSTLSQLSSLACSFPTPGALAFARSPNTILRITPSSFSYMAFRVADLNTTSLQLTQLGWMGGLVGSTGSSQRGSGQLVVKIPGLDGLDIRACDNKSVSPQVFYPSETLNQDSVQMPDSAGESMSCKSVSGLEARHRLLTMASKHFVVRSR